MAEYLSPGVYVEEFDSGAKPMEGVSTSTAGFIGLAERGPTEGNPQLVTNVVDFKRKYGGYLSENEFGEYRYLCYAVEHFFMNGGSRCFISRVAPEDAETAMGYIPDKESPILTFYAKNKGAWGNDLRIRLLPASRSKTAVLERISTSEGTKYRCKNAAGWRAGDIVAFRDTQQDSVRYNKVTRSQDDLLEFAEEFGEEVVDTQLLPSRFLQSCDFSLEVAYEDQVEIYENLSLNLNSPNYITKKTARSELIVVEAGTIPDEIKPPFMLLAGDEANDRIVSMSGGTNGTMEQLSAADFIGKDNGAGKRTGIQAFLDNDIVSIIAVPGVVDPNVQLTLVAHCENLGSRFAILDMPRDAKKTDEILAHREMFDSHYAAFYHPWLKVFDPLDKKNFSIPPSGSVAGIYARSDNTRGVHKAPANEVVRACVGLECNFNKGEQDILNPKGINLIRSFSDMGIRVWGARTASSDGSWKYINVRRLFIFIEESIKANTNWVVFEPNDETLWVRVQRTIDVFLTSLWRNGYLSGNSTAEAFFVNVGRDTMSQDDIDNGRLICVIGVAPVKPAEFVIFRISQKTGDAQ